jgi:DNA-directed RNA polymerase specialized sigma24 family protein
MGLEDRLCEAGLSEREAEAVALRVEGYTYAEAAEEMGIEPGTYSGKMISKIKPKLQQALRLVAIYEEHPEAFPEVDDAR